MGNGSQHIGNGSQNMGNGTQNMGSDVGPPVLNTSALRRSHVGVVQVYRGPAGMPALLLTRNRTQKWKFSSRKVAPVPL